MKYYCRECKHLMEQEDLGGVTNPYTGDTDIYYCCDCGSKDIAQVSVEYEVTTDDESIAVFQDIYEAYESEKKFKPWDPTTRIIRTIYDYDLCEIIEEKEV